MTKNTLSFNGYLGDKVMVLSSCPIARQESQNAQQ
jgi:hypothetical protein